MCPHFFGITWSSRWIAATPACSYPWTVRTTLIALPYPVSASAITGRRRRNDPAGVVDHLRPVSNPTSGRPTSEAVDPNPDM